MKKTVLTSLNGQIIIMSAHRYALGRQTYVVSSTIEWLKENWEHVSSQSRFVILRDTAVALLRNEAGGEMDYEHWRDFWNWGILKNHEFWNDIMNYCKAVCPHPERLFERKELEHEISSGRTSQI
jgi:hypothetical protein